MQQKFKKFYNICIWIQNRFIAQIIGMKTKLDMLCIAWDRKLSELTLYSHKIKNRPLMIICKKARSFSYEIRRKFLYAYLKQCKIYHQIAFFQWRNTFCKNSDIQQLMDCFQTQIGNARRQNPTLVEKYMGRTKKHHLLKSMSKLATKESIPLPKKKLQISLSKKSPPRKGHTVNHLSAVTKISHCISHFEEIGWTDPDVFSKERPSYTLLSSDFNTPAYSIDKFNPKYPPLMAYFFTIKVFRKMMESCY